jgi:hypothetical protein
VPGAVVGAPDVVRVVDTLVGALDGESAVERLEDEAVGRVAQADPVVEPPRALLGEQEVARALSRR